MPLQIGAALTSGAARIASRTGVVLTSVYLVLYVAYQAGYNVLLNALYARTGVGASVVVPVSLPTPVAAAVVVACLVALTTVSVVAVRAFVAGGHLRREHYAEGLLWAVPNLFVGGLVTGLLIGVGFLLLLVPGLVLLVGLLFVPMYVAVEGQNFVAAMGSSWRLARGHRLAVFGLVLVVTAVGLALGAVFGVATVVATLVGYQTALPFLAAVVVAPVTMYNLAAVSAAFEQLRDADGVEDPGADDDPASP